MNSLIRNVAAYSMIFSCAFGSAANAAELSAKQLAASMRDRMLGTARIRVRLETNAVGAQAPVLQLLIKERRTSRRTDVAYEVLWPKEQKGEVVLLQQYGRSVPGGSIFIPPRTVKSLRASDMDEGIFGSDLTYQDAVENFFSWPIQSILGSESIGGAKCVVLESKPGGAGTIYGKVRSWIDPRRLVPMRIEKFSKSGYLLRKIETTQVAHDDQGRPIPGNLVVSSRSGSVTKLSGSRIDRNVHFSSNDFSAAAMTE